MFGTCVIFSKNRVKKKAVPPKARRLPKPSSILSLNILKKVIANIGPELIVQTLVKTKAPMETGAVIDCSFLIDLIKV